MYLFDVELKQCQKPACQQRDLIPHDKPLLRVSRMTLNDICESVTAEAILCVTNLPVVTHDRTLFVMKREVR